jgi:hypothetical protein
LQPPQRSNRGGQRTGKFQSFVTHKTGSKSGQIKREKGESVMVKKKGEQEAQKPFVNVIYHNKAEIFRIQCPTDSPLGKDLKGHYKIWNSPVEKYGDSSNWECLVNEWEEDILNDLKDIPSYGIDLDGPISIPFDNIDYLEIISLGVNKKEGTILADLLFHLNR